MFDVLIAIEKRETSSKKYFLFGFYEATEEQSKLAGLLTNNYDKKHRLKD